NPEVDARAGRMRVPTRCSGPARRRAALDTRARPDVAAAGAARSGSGWLDDGGSEPHRGAIPRAIPRRAANVASAGAIAAARAAVGQPGRARPWRLVARRTA